MSSVTNLPRTVEELTPEWLTAALGIQYPGIEVAAATVEKIIWGTATKVLMNIEYGGQRDANGPPQKLCIKGDFDERIRQALPDRTITGTQIEAEFFNDMAPQLGIPLPRHWFGGSEPGMGVLILDNLEAQNATFGKPTEPWSSDLVSKALDILATLHASTWNRKFANIPWLKVGSASIRQANERLMSEQHWGEHFAKPTVFQLPETLKDRERCLRALRSLWRHDDAHANCLIHGDTHLGNTCIDTNGQPFFIDWAGPCLSCWAFDVSYCIAGALTVADRRATEHDLFHHYLDKLAAYGGPALDRDEAWQDYRRNHLNGLIWTTVPSAMQPEENVHAMGERYAAAIVDHDTLRLLGE